MNVDQWVEVFRETGLDEEMMHRWHCEFEHRYPDEHETFLKWLNLSSDAILAIRKDSQGN